MTVCITLSPVQRTHDGHDVQVVTIAEALTGLKVGRFELVTCRDGRTVYRGLDGSAFPAGLDAHQQERRATRPAGPNLAAVA